MVVADMTAAIIISHCFMNVTFIASIRGQTKDGIFKKFRVTLSVYRKNSEISLL
jgi:hypothetical protein